jgi:hypothetical protein
LIHPEAVEEFLSASKDSLAWVKDIDEDTLDKELRAIGFRVADPKAQPLTKHQKACIFLCLAYPYLALWLDMGLGKTRIMLEVMNYRFGRTQGNPVILILVPTEEVIEVWVKQVKQWGINIPLDTIGNMPSSDKWLTFMELDWGILVATYPGICWLLSKKVAIKKGKKTVYRLKLNQKAVDKFAANITAVIYDQCFPAGTLVKLERGDCPIEDVVVGDEIVSSCGTRIVRRLLSKESSFITTVRLASGQTITSTPDHPFFTDQGWVCAGNLEGRLLYDYGSVQKLWNRIPGKRGRVLQQVLRSEMVRQTSSESVNRSESIKENSSKNKASPEKTNHYRRDKGQDECDYDWEAASLGQREALMEQKCSDVICIKKEIEQNPTKNEAPSSSTKSWGEWYWPHYPAEISMGSIRPAMDFGARHFIGEEAARLSNLLQGRFRIGGEENSYRSGRDLAQLEYKIGQKEGQEVTGVRVESVTSEQHIRPVKVYSLEVEGCPHFFAGGYLVHNSTKVGGVSTPTFRVCRAISKKAKYRYALAGRPFGRDPTPLWGQQWLVDQGETLGETLTLFRNAFFKEKRNYFGGYDYKFRKEMEDKLAEIMQHRSIAYSSGECLTLPKVTKIQEEVRLPEDARAYYEKAVAAIRKAKGNHIETKNLFLRMRQLSSGFLGYKNDETGEKAQLVFPTNPKLDRMLDLIESVPYDRKFVIFYEFTHSGKTIHEALNDMGIKNGWLWAGTKDSRTMQRQFDDDPKMRGLVVNWRKGAMGPNWQVANYKFFFESPVSSIDREEAERRCFRQGQKLPGFMYDMMARGTVDARILEFHASGESLFKSLLRDPYGIV